jgi:hypothetical protein
LLRLVRPSVRPHGTTRLPLDGFSCNLIFECFRKSVEKIRVSLQPDKNTGTFPEDQYTFLIISCSFLLRMRNVSQKSCRENQNTFCVQYLFSENRAVYQIMWKNIVERGRPQTTTWRKHTACWLPKATNTLKICNTHCFSTATMVARTRLHVTLYVHCPSRSVSFPLTSLFVSQINVVYKSFGKFSTNMKMFVHNLRICVQYAVCNGLDVTVSVPLVPYVVRFYTQI